MFSFGIVLWELLTGEEPYADLHYGVIIGKNPLLYVDMMPKNLFLRLVKHSYRFQM